MEDPAVTLALSILKVHQWLQNGCKSHGSSNYLSLPVYHLSQTTPVFVGALQPTPEHHHLKPSAVLPLKDPFEAFRAMAQLKADAAAAANKCIAVDAHRIADKGDDDDSSVDTTKYIKSNRPLMQQTTGSRNRPQSTYALRSSLRTLRSSHTPLVQHPATTEPRQQKQPQNSVHQTLNAISELKSALSQRQQPVQPQLPAQQPEPTPQLPPQPPPQPVLSTPKKRRVRNKARHLNDRRRRLQQRMQPPRNANDDDGTSSSEQLSSVLLIRSSHRKRKFRRNIAPKDTAPAKRICKSDENNASRDADDVLHK